MSKYKIGDMYAPKSILMAVCQMASEADPIRRMYDALRKNPMDFNSPRRISMVYEETGILYLEGIPVPIKFNDMKGLFNPVWVAPEPETEITIHVNKGEEVPRENSAVVLDKFFKTAHSVKNEPLATWFTTCPQRLGRSPNVSFSLNAAVISSKKALMRSCVRWM